MADFGKLYALLKKEYPFYDAEEIVETFGNHMDDYLMDVLKLNPDTVGQDLRDDLYIGFGQYIDEQGYI